MNRPLTIFLAGDSTVQSYSDANAPQAGWGQALIRHLSDGAWSVHPSHSSHFESSTTYEAQGLRIDNRAFAGRSTKSYLAEGRMEDLLADFQEGDLLLMQFGHNDANQEKEERYVTPAQFQDKLLEGFIRPVRARGGRPVLVTPLAMRVFDEQGTCPPSFQEYREAMMALGAAEDVPVIDLGRMSADFNTRIGAEACKSLYLWVPAGIWPDRPEGSTDDAHIQYTGAHIYAGLVAEELRSLGFLCDRRTV